MKELKELIAEAANQKRALGHFNISNLEALWAIFRAARGLDRPVIIGVSEGERDFVGVRQAAALVKSLREEFDYPIFLNADHTHSLERVREAVDAGFDAVLFDGGALSLEENIVVTRQCVEYAKMKSANRRTAIVVEGELGYIGASSEVIDEVPAGAATAASGGLTAPETARQFVAETGVDLLAPAVGNIHGMLRDRPDPRLDIERIRAVREAAGVPLVLHGASGNSAEDIRAAIAAGASIVHINTELRVAFRDALRLSLQEAPDEVAPYKIMKPAAAAMQKVVEQKLRLFGDLA